MRKLIRDGGKLPRPSSAAGRGRPALPTRNSEPNAPKKAKLSKGRLPEATRRVRKHPRTAGRPPNGRRCGMSGIADSLVRIADALEELVQTAKEEKGKSPLHPP